MTDAPTMSGDGGVLLPSSAVGARWDTDGRDTSRTLAAGVPAALQSLARHDDGMAHPSSGVSTPPACVGATGGRVAWSTCVLAGESM
ncbi:hypothetical protein C435_04178 [Haloarcula marismortui ATCC 33799]|uniref:Uncharacterized protein n=1 Tax=Haloarcula marismortui ATCC 33799 TaxID=662475 RepID=M0KNQ2_9EURY|nr:hypothetical protein C435_04178 [Haloarcula californiae ATCC 33799]